MTASTFGTGASSPFPGILRLPARIYLPKAGE